MQQQTKCPFFSFFSKVADFGQARPLVNIIPVQQLGTLLWTASEILNTEGQSQKSDTWSYGSTKEETFSEQIPYEHLHRYDPREIKKVLRKIENRELARTNRKNNTFFLLDKTKLSSLDPKEAQLLQLSPKSPLADPLQLSTKSCYSMP